MREDYSADGNAWDFLTHDMARSKAYRWGEDGIGGWSDENQVLCLSLALWNGKDPILKERLFGLSGHEGNHGEDVKEVYYYVDATPTHSYMRMVYKYPQSRFPYEELARENRRRTRAEPEYELVDTGVLDGGRYFDVVIEYAKSRPDETFMRISAINRGPEPATLCLLPQVWFRNTWAWGVAASGLGSPSRPVIRRMPEANGLVCEHADLGKRYVFADGRPELLFTENESNNQRLYGVANVAGHVKDAFHEYVVGQSPRDRGKRRPGDEGGAALSHGAPGRQKRGSTAGA